LFLKKTLSELQESDVGLYNRLIVFHDFHVLNKASKDKVMTGSTSDVKNCFKYQPKGSDADYQYY